MTYAVQDPFKPEVEIETPCKNICKLWLLVNKTWNHFHFQLIASRKKHILHCLLMIAFMITPILIYLDTEVAMKSSIYGRWTTYALYVIRILSVLMSLPYEVMVFIGLFFYNAFPGPMHLKRTNMADYPFICFRVATKGLCQNLVRSTVARNLKIILDKGVTMFQIQVVTNNFVPGISSHPQVEQMVVPEDYETKSGSLYKARNLQYALEQDCLYDNDWLVHLDEETLLTPNSLSGILNFVAEGKHQFGQGLVTYSNDGVVNWTTTLADINRLADDLGKIRAQFKLFHAPLFSMKGTYTVCQVGAERKIGFDDGPDASIAEDCHFVMKAYEMGYSFGFIEGEMWEFSPFTLWDFVLQRKRWFQGILLVIYTSGRRFKIMIWLIIDFHNKFLQPVPWIFVLLDLYKVVPVPVWFQLVAFPFYGLRVYMYVFGILKSAECSNSPNEKRYLRLIGLSLYTIIIVRTIHTAMDIVAMVLGLWQSKHGFYLVKKEIQSRSKSDEQV